ncbi:MAG: hypothetical protein AAGD07_24655, partial [Planctomycetota bacterium]
SGVSIAALEQVSASPSQPNRPIYKSEIGLGSFTFNATVVKHESSATFFVWRCYALFGTIWDSVSSGWFVNAITTFRPADGQLISTIGIGRGDDTSQPTYVTSDQSTATGQSEPGSIDLVVSFDGTDLTADWQGLSVTHETGDINRFVGFWSRDQQLERLERFKLWTSNSPEPPWTESGHGTHDGTSFVYTDKYHSGGSYDPNA